MTSDPFSDQIAKMLQRTLVPRREDARTRAVTGARVQAEALARARRGTRPASRLGVAVAGAAILLLLFGSLTPPGRAVADDLGELIGIGEEPPAPTSAVSACPDDITISPAPGCKLIAKRARLIDCPRSPVGNDVHVSGISCRDAYDLLTPLGSAGVPGLGTYKRSRQTLYRPAVATYKAPYEVRSTGWTCWNSFERGADTGVQFTCWNADSVLSFRFTG